MLRLWPKMRFLPLRFGKDERGATAIEYGLIVSGVAIAILATVFAMGAELNNLFDHVASAFGSKARCVQVSSNCDQ